MSPRSADLERPVLVWAKPFDVTADRVVLALERLDVPVFRCDTSEFPAHLDLSTHLDSRGTGWSGRLIGAAHELDLSAVRACYHRRPGPISVPDVAADTQAFAAEEARAGFVGLLQALPCPWVNHPERIRATTKPAQLATAAHLGLHPPRSIITNDPEFARGFADDLAGTVVYKTLGDTVLDDGTRAAAAATEVTTRELDESIRTTAHFFQERIDKTHDVRLTVVGQQMFAVEIHTCDGRLDWRTDYDDLTYRITNTPAPVRTAVAKLMQRFELTFGALDFAVEPDGHWRFLELNPNGQWVFIEDATGIAISDSIAAALAAAG